MAENNIDFRELEKMLITLYGKIELIEEIKRQKGDEFNIFSILNMERLEVSTHSAFIYELIYPNGTHFQKDAYLKIFVEEVLNIKDFAFENAEVGRETVIDNSRRIDFTIENADYYIAIEMKIDATDQEAQISDYYKYAEEQAEKQNKIPKVYYLTLDGKDADEKSSKGIDYERISFQFHILNFIEKSIEKSANLPIIRESLIQYRNLILKITNQTTQELQMESIKFINTPEMAKAAMVMSKNLAYAWAKREVIFWRKLVNMLEKYIKDKKGWSLIPWILLDNDEKNLLSDDEIAKWILKQNKYRLRGLKLQKEDLYFHVYIYNGGSFEYYILKDKNIEEVAEKINIKNHVKGYPNERYTTTKYKNENYNFYKDYSEPTYDIFDDKKLDKIVENIYNETVRYMDKIIEEFK
jgi:hypothetical protein